MKTRLYINNELCREITQLQDYVRSLSYGSEIYSDILEYALCGDLTAWLHEHGHKELADKVASIDKTIGDTEFVNKLTNMLLGEASTIKKPNYSNCFSIDISIPSKSSKEVVVLLSITPKNYINENFEIKVTCGWGTKARVFNPCQCEVNIVYNDTISFHRRSNKEIGKIVVTIEDEQVFEKWMELPKPEAVLNSSIQSGSISKRSELVDYIQSVVEHVNSIVQTAQSQIGDSSIKFQSSTPKKKEPEYIRTAGGLIPKDEWLKRREQERLARDESQRKIEEALRQEEEALREKDEEKEREAMAERFRERQRKKNRL